MIRTSLFLPDTLHQRLLIAANWTDKSLSELVRDLLDKSLINQEQTRIAKMYQALKEVEGIGKDNITDASTTINETLYGDQGTWRPRE